MAEKGLLICVPAGKADLVDRVRPYCVGVYDFVPEQVEEGALTTATGLEGV